jgi:hypothetical protein
MSNIESGIMNEDGVVFLSSFKWSKKCELCKMDIQAGDQGFWDKRSKPYKYYHTNCYKKQNLKNLNTPTPQMREKAGAFLGKEGSDSPSGRVAPASKAYSAPEALPNSDNSHFQASGLNANSTSTRSSKPEKQDQADGRGLSISPPLPLDALAIEKLYSNALANLEAKGLPTDCAALTAVALDIELSRAEQKYKLDFAKWEQEQKTKNILEVRKGR